MLQRPRPARCALALLAALATATPSATATAQPAAPPPAAGNPPAAPATPRGSRTDGDRVRSALGFRATVDHFERLFRKDGTPVRRIGPYHQAGVDVVRFLALAPSPPWRAVHVYRVAGVTWIFVVAAPLDAARPTE